MERYIISDLHLGHKNIISYENRPFKDVDEMNETIIRNWNNVVSKEDEVYLLGDVSMKLSKDELKEYLARLNGKVTLVMGNHDKKPSGFGYNWFKETGLFYQVSPHPIIIDNFFILSHEPMYMESRSPYANLYGHVHGDNRYKNYTSNTACVCCERWNYTPINLNDLIEKMRDYE